MMAMVKCRSVENIIISYLKFLYFAYSMLFNAAIMISRLNLTYVVIRKLQS
jgi:hypothetical protein